MSTPQKNPEQQLPSDQEEGLSSPNIFLKLTDVKKDTTELMVRNLLKKNSTIQFKSINLVQKSDQTTVFIEFHSQEEANQVRDEIQGEKLNKKTFKALLVPSPDLPLANPNNLQNEDNTQNEQNPPNNVFDLNNEDSSSISINQEAIIQALIAANRQQQSKTNKKLPRSKVRFSPQKYKLQKKTSMRKQRRN